MYFRNLFLINQGIHLKISVEKYILEVFNLHTCVVESNMNYQQIQHNQPRTVTHRKIRNVFKIIFSNKYTIMLNRSKKTRLLVGLY